MREQARSIVGGEWSKPSFLSRVSKYGIVSLLYQVIPYVTSFHRYITLCMVGFIILVLRMRKRGWAPGDGNLPWSHGSKVTGPGFKPVQSRALDLDATLHCLAHTQLLLQAPLDARDAPRAPDPLHHCRALWGQPCAASGGCRHFSQTPGGC